ncbi:MAG: hypothetical protein NTW21_23865 [Verrucomicrobia bacterium]|nr:hypothetical protein [Verrucomicrobiota bacterium]
MSDTPLELNSLIHRRVMALGEERRFLMGMSMLATVRELILSSLPASLTRQERMLALYQRLYGCPFPLSPPA